MGIEYYFARISHNDIESLYAHPSRETIDTIFRSPEMQVVFSPYDEDERPYAARHVAMDHGLWHLLRDLIPPSSSTLNPWLPAERGATEHGTTISTEWMGYSPLYVLEPESVQSLGAWLTQVTHTHLSQRFGTLFAQDDSMDAEEQEGLLQTILACFDDIYDLFIQASVHKESIIWYIS